MLFAIIHYPDKHKTPQMCEKDILKNPEMLQFIPSYKKTWELVKKQLIIVLMHYNMFLIAIWLKKICKKAVNAYHSALIHVPDSYKT